MNHSSVLKVEIHKYLLNSVIEHSGISRHGGHYVALINHEGVTYRLDDNLVSISTFGLLHTIGVEYDKLTVLTLAYTQA